MCFLFVFFPLEQEGIAPQMFKALVGRGHPEFSTNRQQDAQEFFLHLFTTIDRTEVSVVKLHFALRNVCGVFSV